MSVNVCPFFTNHVKEHTVEDFYVSYSELFLVIVLK